MTSAAAIEAGVQIREIGSFHAGGKIVTLKDQPRREVQVARNGPSRMVDLNGDYVTGQCYVQFVKQATPAFDAPVMFWHGGAMTGVTWESTPDGRPGWQNWFMQAGFDTYVCDAVERGRSGWSPYPEIFETAPIFRTQDEAWGLFRFGEAGTYGDRQAFDGLQFPADAMDRFGSQFVPRWTCHGPQTLAAYEAALERIGPVWLIAHSQGGNFAMEAAARWPQYFKGVVVIEPAAAPADTGAAHEVPHLFLWGDYLDASDTWMSYREKVDGHVETLRSRGGTADVMDLPAMGIKGNSHVPMMDSNSDQVAQIVFDWIRRQNG